MTLEEYMDQSTAKHRLVQKRKAEVKHDGSVLKHVFVYWVPLIGQVIQHNDHCHLLFNYY